MTLKELIESELANGKTYVNLINNLSPQATQQLVESIIGMALKIEEQSATIEKLEVTCLTYKLIVEEVREGRLILTKG